MASPQGLVEGGDQVVKPVPFPVHAEALRPQGLPHALEVHPAEACGELQGVQGEAGVAPGRLGENP